MALPTSGQLTFSQIYLEVYGVLPQSEVSLRAMSLAAGKTIPDQVSDFYGYSNTPTLTVSPSSMYWLGSDSGSGYGVTATVTIVPDATFTSTIPTWISRTYNYTSNTMWYYPNSINPSLISSRTYSSAVSASGYVTDYILLSQAASGSATHGITQPTCLAGETLILMADATEKRIDELKIGDDIVSFNKNTAMNEPSTIEGIVPVEHYDMIDMMVDGVKITCTVDHPFLSDYGWVSYHPTMTINHYENLENVSKLEKGVRIYRYDSSVKFIDSVICYHEKTLTYQITKLSKNEIYYANKFTTKVEPK